MRTAAWGLSPMRAVRHRDDDVGACAGALAREERGEDLRHRAEAPAARSAAGTGGSAGAVAASTPAQPR